MKWYRLSGLRLELEDSYAQLAGKIEKKCGFPDKSLSRQDIVLQRESLDARKKLDLHRVLTVDFKYGGKLSRKAKKCLSPVPTLPTFDLKPGTEKLTGRPVVVGFGPCGIFAALQLARAGYCPLVIERGCAMEKRVRDVENFWYCGCLNPESNVLFGEGGAGTFSDGKLTTGIKDIRIRQVLEDFVSAGAPEDILWQQKPHIGTDFLRHVVVNLRHEIEKAGGEVWFETLMMGIHFDAAGKINGLQIKKREAISMIETNAVILAPGHSARDTFRMLKGLPIPMEQKPFSIGVRIEHSQKMIDEAQYGKVWGLPPAAYKLSYKASNGRGVYSFCMCPGGKVISCSNQPGLLCVNGMSDRKRDSGIANAGILVDVRPLDFSSEDVLAGVDFQEKWERLCFEAGGGCYVAPRCSWKNFRNQDALAAPVIACLPDFAAEALREAIPVFGKKISGFDADDAVMTAVETRSSSPVRVLRNAQGESEVHGLFPAGEGAGYAGGIMSAACDGLKAAEALIRKYSKPVFDL